MTHTFLDKAWTQFRLHTVTVCQISNTDLVNWVNVVRAKLQQSFCRCGWELMAELYNLLRFDKTFRKVKCVSGYVCSENVNRHVVMSCGWDGARISVLGGMGSFWLGLRLHKLEAHYWN